MNGEESVNSPSWQHLGGRTTSDTTLSTMAEHPVHQAVRREEQEQATHQPNSSDTSFQGFQSLVEQMAKMHIQSQHGAQEAAEKQADMLRSIIDA